MNEGHQSVRTYQYLFFANGILYPLWGHIMFMALPSSVDHTPSRYGIAALSFAGAFLIQRYKKYSEEILLGMALIVISHIIYLTGLNRLAYNYTFGTFMATFCISICFQARRSLVIFNSYAIILSVIWLNSQEALMSLEFFIAILGTSFVASFISFYQKYSLIQLLKTANSRLEESQAAGKIGTWVYYVNEDRWLLSDFSLKLHGYPQGNTNSVETSSLKKRYSPYSRGLFEKQISGLKRGHSFSGNFCLNHSDSGNRWLRISGELKSGPESGAVAIGTFQDISTDIEHNMSKMESLKMINLGEMAGGIAHEINNPATIIKMLCAQVSGILKTSFPGQKTLLDKVHIIDDNVDRISNVIMSLKDFSRESGGDPYQRCDVEDILKDTLKLCKEKLRSRDITINVEGKNPDLEIFCDQAEIVKVLINLIQNSFDAVKDDDGDKWIEVECRAEEELVKIKITDSGKIAEEIADKIMRPFFSTREIGQGTGLGLSVSQGIIEKHGGTLTLMKSCPNTTFVITLPRYKNVSEFLEV